LKGKRLCYFHEESRKRHPNRVALPPVLLVFPIMEDARSVQIALSQVMQALVHRTIDHDSTAAALRAGDGGWASEGWTVKSEKSWVALKENQDPS